MEKHHLNGKLWKDPPFSSWENQLFRLGLFNSYVSLPEGIGPKNGWR